MKKTLCFGSPAYIRAGLRQLDIELPATAGQAARKQSIPLEDIGVLILEHPQITLSHAAMSALMDQNVAVITCNEKYLPNGLFLPLDGHSLQSRRFQAQVDASLPLKKQLWQQTVQQKIRNQARVLLRQGIPAEPLLRWSLEVRSGDPDNLEARAAAWYWPVLFSQTPLFQDYDILADDPDDFIRDRYGEWPNALLNYGYAILRAVVARALVGAGLLPTLGIHHRNQYNAYCLADDIMEPFRPSVDQLVVTIVKNHPEITDTPQLTPALKRELLQIPVLDVLFDNKNSPLQEAARRCAASLAACFSGEQRKINYPESL
jgi:CRISP-associated protein Cas1